MSRRKAREFALQLLFQEDMAKQPPEEIQRTFWELNPAPPEIRRFADCLFENTLKRRDEIDAIIRRFAEHWKIDRMAAVDRNVLRMAVGEFLLDQTPRIVVIDESIEIARRYGTERSSEFVNGILDAIRASLGEPSSETVGELKPD